MFFSIIIIFNLLFLAQASPLDSRSAKCHPNFKGVGVSVVWDQAPYNTREWAPGAVGSNLTTRSDNLNQAAEFQFEPIGSAPQNYIAKKLGVSSNNQVISVGSNQYLDIAQLRSGDPTQVWEVSCDTCATNARSMHGLFANACTIKSVRLGLCAQVITAVTHAMEMPSFLVKLAPCDGVANQNFQFWMV